MTASEMQAILDRIEYKEWIFHAKEHNGSIYLQVGFMAACSLSGEESLQKGRKWLLSQHATPSEIVTTALKAVLTAEEHEAREQFRYKGAAVFGPHIDVEALLEVATREDRRAVVP